MFLSLEELTSPNSRVLVCLLVDLNCIVSAEEGDDEFSVLFIFVLRDHPCLKSHDVLIVCEDFGHILFGGFGLKTVDTAKRIFRGSVAIEGRNLMLDRSSLLLLGFFERKIYTKFVLEVCLGEVISIDYLAFPAKDIDGFSSSEIFRAIVVFAFETHARIDSVDSFFGKFLSIEQQREGVSS